MPNKEDDVVKDEAKPASKKASVKPKMDQVSRRDEAKSAKSAEAEAEVKGSAKPEPKADKAPEAVEAKPMEVDEAKKSEDKPEAASVATKTTTNSAAGLSGVKARDVRSLAIKVLAAVVALLAVVVIVFGVLIYAYRSENPAVKAVAQVIPYPVERVNGHFVTYKQYLFEVEANERAYQNNAKLNNQPAVDFKSEEGKKLVKQIKEHAMEKLVNDSLVAQLAAQKKVKVTDKEVDDLLNQLYQRYGSKDTLLKTLNQIYGWNANDLRMVIYKQLLAKNLEEKVTSDPSVDAAAKKKAQDVLKQIKDGADFTEVAKKNSQASDAASGGDLGFFTKGQLPDELQKAAEALQPGQVSDPVKDQYGYEIIKVIEKKDDGSIHAQHILIKTIDFNEYFDGELKKAKVNKFISV